MARLLGIAPLSHLELSPPQMVTNAAQAGYDTLGLRLIAATPEEPQHNCLRGTTLMHETARRLADTGARGPRCRDLQAEAGHAGC